MTAINSEAVDDYVAKRRKERGKKRDSTVSKATINKELRHLRAIFRKAQLWGYVKIAPQITFFRSVKLTLGLSETNAGRTEYDQG